MRTPICDMPGIDFARIAAVSGAVAARVPAQCRQFVDALARREAPCC